MAGNHLFGGGTMSELRAFVREGLATARTAPERRKMKSMVALASAGLGDPETDRILTPLAYGDDQTEGLRDGGLLVTLALLLAGRTDEAGERLTG